MKPNTLFDRVMSFEQIPIDTDPNAGSHAVETSIVRCES